MIGIWIALALLAAQQFEPEEGTRQLWNTAFQAKRTGAKAAGAPSDAANSIVGITVWLLRDSQPGDDKEIRISARAGDKEWTPVRVEAETPLVPGARVRVGIETARTGYLYVIDREQYADGSLGTPSLIFPTLRTRSGNNQVTAGRLVEIPSLEDNPRYFTIRMSRADQVAEVLTVLVTPQPLAEVKIPRDPIPLAPAQVEAWQKRWGAKVEKLEARRQTGKVYTRAEKDAAALGTRLLTHDEPLPQTMYRLEAKPGEPLLVNVPLKIRR